MNNKFKASLISLPLLFSMTGCVIVATDDAHDMDWNSSKDESWKQEQKTNNRHIASLSTGATYDDVRMLMGTPRFNEAFSEGADNYQVIFYRTRHVHGDNKTTKDECTPLIFKNGVLVGFGEKAYNKL